MSIARLLYVPVAIAVLATAASSAAAQDLPEKKVIGTMAPTAMLAPAILVGNTLYISGATPPRTMADSGLAAQTKATITSIRTRLQAAGMDLSDVVSVTAYLADIKDFNDFNAGYTELFTGAIKPTRTTVAVAGLVGGAKLELTMIAVKSK